MITGVFFPIRIDYTISFVTVLQTLKTEGDTPIR